jgi:hypothetical protein
VSPEEEQDPTFSRESLDEARKPISACPETPEQNSKIFADMGRICEASMPLHLLLES